MFLLVVLIFGILIVGISAVDMNIEKIQKPLFNQFIDFLREFFGGEEVLLSLADTDEEWTFRKNK